MDPTAQSTLGQRMRDVVLDKILPLLGVFLTAAGLWWMARSAGWLTSSSGIAVNRVSPSPNVVAADRSNLATTGNRPGQIQSKGDERSWGPFFQDPPADPFALPRVEQIPIPEFPGSYAIWGATGRDDLGHIWFGVSSDGVPTPSAHLFQYRAASRQLTDWGDAVGQLQRSGLHREGESQMKIHSRIVMADDGYLYFASMDEHGESAASDRPPTWGSHLWRMKPQGGPWEHLRAVPEGLIAVSCTGRLVYALGYYDHMLYQYDTQTGQFRQVKVGSVGGHISRNFVSDYRGHVYVPRLREASVEDKKAAAAAGAKAPDILTTLVEFNGELEELRETPLDHYGADRPGASHGIIAFTYLVNRWIVVATHKGFLYMIAPQGQGPAAVTPLGWFHPEGATYTPALFSFAGRRYLLGIAQRGGGRFDWLVYDLRTRSGHAEPLQLPQLSRRGQEKDLLLYGSTTRDNQGAFYLAGRYIEMPEFRKRPVLLRLQVPTGSVAPTPRSDSVAAPLADSTPLADSNRVVKPENALTESASPAEDRVRRVLLAANGYDWLAMPEAERRDLCSVATTWLQPGDMPQAREQLVQHYVAALDEFYREPGNQGIGILEILPVIHAIATTENGLP